MRPYPRRHITDGLTEAQKKAYFGDVLTAKRGYIDAACKSLGIRRRQYEQWLEEDPEFAEDCREAREGLIDWVESKQIENIDKNQSRDIQFFLKSQAKDRGYGDSISHEFSGQINHAHWAVGYPKEPASLADWEDQVEEAKQRRKDRQAASIDAPNRAQDSTSPITEPASDTINTGPVAPTLALVEVTS